MNFKKLQSLVDKGIIIDIDGAHEHEVRVKYALGDGEKWFEFTPEVYKDEEELAAVINTEAERKLHGKIKTRLEEEQD